MMAAWVAFVRDGAPAVEGRTWPRFERDRPQLLAFQDAGATAVTAPDRSPGLACWPAYR